MARGFKSGGRKPLSEAGAAVIKAVRFPPDLMTDVEAMAADTGESVADIVRRGARREVDKWKKRRAKG